jgi:hypothetical protein
MHQLSHMKNLLVRSTFQSFQKAGVGVQELFKDMMLTLLSAKHISHKANIK